MKDYAQHLEDMMSQNMEEVVEPSPWQDRSDDE